SAAITTTEASYVVRGKVKDALSLSMVNINGYEQYWDHEGANFGKSKEISFEYPISLAVGANKVTIVAADHIGNLAKQEVTITRTTPRLPGPIGGFPGGGIPFFPPVQPEEVPADTV